jgi:hypothetical protein
MTPSGDFITISFSSEKLIKKLMKDNHTKKKVKLDTSIDHQYLKKKVVEVVGVSFCGGQPKKGVDQGPLLMLQRGLVSQITGLGWEVSF